MDILPRKKKPSVKISSRKPVAFSLNTDNSSINKKPLSPKTKTRRKSLRYALVSINILILATVGYLVVNYSTSTTVSYGSLSGEESRTINPLDKLSSADIAANIANMTGMPEALAVNNQANTVNLYLNASVTERDYVTKSQILSPEIKSKEDIVIHTVVEGDTLASLARKYGVTSDSIAWSNDVRYELVPGMKLYIPPVNGLIYQVGVNDTPQVIADRFTANAEEIVAFNDAEISGLLVGDRIVVPDGVKPRTLSDLRNYQATYGYNGYWYGYCTWYVATRIDVPNNWGDANTWDNYARVTPGWVVTQTPVVGSIAQSNRGPDGHVAVVEEVSEDGKFIKFSDMNGLAGWNRVGLNTEWLPIDGGFGFENFIYRGN